MHRKYKLSRYLSFSLAIIIVVILFSTSMVASQGDPLTEIEEKLAGITEEEKKILQNLFTLTQEIEELEREEENTANDIERIEKEIFSLDMIIRDEQEKYEEKREVLKKLLNSYQKRGPGTYLEIILDSDNLSMLLRRLNALRDITKNTGELMKSIEESRNKLSLQKEHMNEKLALLQEKQNELQEFILNKLSIREELEDYLDSLEEQREHFQENIENINIMWTELKPLFSKLIEEFSNIIEEGNLPEDAIKTTFSLTEIKGSLNEETFNKIIKDNNLSTEMVFKFSQKGIELNIPEKNLVLIGTFVILEGHILKFEVREGSFFEMPLSEGSLKELFDEDMLLDLEPLIGRNKINSIEIKDKYIELLIKLVLF